MVRRIAAAPTGAALISLLVAGCSGGVDRSGNKTDVGFRVSPLDGPTTEQGTQVEFSVVLRTKPKGGDVIVPLSSSDVSEGTVSPSQLVFTSEDWQSAHAVTVVGVDDDVVDGHASYDVIFGAVQSADKNYAGLQAAAIPVVNLDDEHVGVLVSPVSGPTTESGGEAQFSIALTAKPTAIVSLPYSSSDDTEGDVNGQSIEFSPDDWNVPQTITLSGVDDGQPDGSQTFAVVFAPLISADLAWDGFEPQSVLVVNVDDDAPGITVGPPSGSTTEAGNTATFSVVLNSEPASAVVVSLVSDDDTEAAVTPSSLTFTADDYDVVRMVTVTGVDDDAADGTTGYQIDFMPAVSLDLAYDGVTPSSVDLFNTDDEVAAIDIAPLNGLTSESGDSAVFDVVLAARPSTDVVLEATVSNKKEATVSPASITFTAMNWDDPVPVTVTGRNDFLDDGHKPYQLVLTPTGDTTYAESGPAMAQLTNVNDGPPARVLIYDDGFGTHADEVATSMNLVPTAVTTQADFLTEIASRPDVVVWEASSGAALDPGIEPAVTAWLTSGGRLIYSDTALGVQSGMQALLGVTAANPYDGFRSLAPQETLRGNIFSRAQSVPSPLTGVNVVPGTNGNELTLTSTSSGSIAGTVVTTTTGLIAVTNDNMVIVNGFAPDDAVGTNNDGDALADMAELYQNEFQYLLDLPARQWRQDFNTATAVPALTTVDIQGAVPVDEIISKLRVSWYITHTNVTDLEIFLVAPDGTTRMELVTDRAGSGDNFGSACTPDSARMTIDDGAPARLSSFSSTGAPFAGTWLPEFDGELSAVDGMSTSGDWTLEVTDDSGSSTSGTVQCWSLLFSLEEE